MGSSGITMVEAFIVPSKTCITSTKSTSITSRYSSKITDPEGEKNNNKKKADGTKGGKKQNKTSMKASVASDVSPRKTNNSDKEWSPSSWKNFEKRQMPVYDDPAEVDKVEEALSKSAPLVFAGE